MTRPQILTGSIKPSFEMFLWILRIPFVATVSLKMKSKSLVGRDTFLGEAEVPLTSLISEQELSGWFALKPKKYSQTGMGPESLSFSSLVCGSIKVRIQWIHSIRALVEYIENEGKK
jgi:hypothetical protein